MFSPMMLAEFLGQEWLYWWQFPMLGLLIVMFAFLVYAITSNPLFYSIFGYWGFGMGPFQMIPDIFGTIALSVLLYLSLK